MTQILVDCAEALSALIFGWYGMTCFFSQHMIDEFARWELPYLRKPTGVMQVSASLGLILGHFYFRELMLLSAGGLAAMMFCALLARIRIKDEPLLVVPAFTLMMMNLFICFKAR